MLMLSTKNKLLAAGIGLSLVMGIPVIIYGSSKYNMPVSQIKTSSESSKKVVKGENVKKDESNSKTPVSTMQEPTNNSTQPTINSDSALDNTPSSTPISQTQPPLPPTPTPPPPGEPRAEAWAACVDARNALLLPIKIRMDESWAYYVGLEDRKRQRASGYIVTEAQIQRMIAQESPPLFNAWDANFQEYHRVLAANPC